MKPPAGVNHTGNPVLLAKHSAATSGIVKFFSKNEVTNRSYHLSDCGSTNGTLLNGHPLDQTPQPLKDGDVMSFARYEFTFMFPASLYEKLGMDAAIPAPA